MNIKQAIETLENKNKKYTVPELFTIITGWDNYTKNPERTFWANMLGDNKYLLMLYTYENSSNAASKVGNALGMFAKSEPLSVTAQLKTLFKEVEDPSKTHLCYTKQEAYIAVVLGALKEYESYLGKAEFHDPDTLLSMVPSFSNSKK